MIHFSVRLSAVLVVVSAFAGLATAQTLIPSIPSAGLRFVAVTPCRVVDTRNTAGTFGGPIMAAGSTRQFPIPIGSCSIPSSAAAYALNVTVIPKAALNYLTIWPAEQTQPVVSTINSDGRTKAAAAIVPAGPGGTGVDVYVSDDTHVILDINGYFTSSGTLAYFPVTPCRAVDTRLANAPLGGPFIGAGLSRSFPVLSSSCGIPSTAQAYALNMTALPRGALGFITAWPSGQGQPAVSTLNATTGQVTANAAIVPAGTSGAITVYASNSSDILLDINGYFAPPASGGLGLYPLSAPCRILDSRLPLNSPPFSGTIVVNVTGSSCGPDVSSAQAYVLNTTVQPTGSLGWLTLWPDGATQPTVSTLNAYDGTVTSNLAIVPTTNGSIDAYASNSTYLILDIASYFAP